MLKAIVCVIDGDPAVRDSLETLMMLNGHEVATYATGMAFLNELDPPKIKCVVCEAELPDTTGFAIFETLREQNFEAPFACSYPVTITPPMTKPNASALLTFSPNLW